MDDDKKARDARLAYPWTQVQKSLMTVAEAKQALADHESAVADGLQGQTDPTVLERARIAVARTFADSDSPVTALPPIRQLPPAEEEPDPTMTGLGVAS